MLPPVRHGIAHSERVLALVISLLLGGTGCGHPPLLVAPHRYVRLEALLPLHPSWTQVQALDREVARLKIAPAQAGSLRYEPHTALPVLVPHLSQPANRAAQRAAQVEQDARRYVTSLRNSLDDADRAIMSLERRREQRRTEAVVAERLAEEAKALRNINNVKLFAIVQRLRSLTFEDIVVKSRIQDFAQAHTRDTRPLREAQDRHTRIVAEMDRLKAESRELRTQDLALAVSRKRDQFSREEEARSRELLAKRQDDLQAAKAERLASAMREQRDTTIPPPVVQKLPPEDPNATPLPLPPEAGPTLVPARLAVQPALDRQAVLWRSQRTDLVNEIRADTLKAVQQVALRRGWILAPGPRPGALDGTDEAADDLRAQWRFGKGQ